MRARLAVLAVVLIAALLALVSVWRLGKKPSSAGSNTSPATNSSAPTPSSHSAQASGLAPTNVYAHNLMLRKGPSFRIYVRWLRGQLKRSRRNINPSFDDPDSFYLDIQTGVVRANIGDLGNFLNASTTSSSPLKNISLSGDGDQIKLKATVHKIVPLPIEVRGTIAVAPDNRIQVHVTKLDVLKVPVKGLLGEFHIKLAELFDPKTVPGIQVTGNDIFFDTQTFLPPPHIRGQLTKIHVVNPDLEEVYGDAKPDVSRVEQWRNFLRLTGGTIDFGKLTMNHVDLIMIDISNDAWFDLDLNNYQEQLVNGYTRMTPQAGLQIFMPDLSQIPKNKTTQNISLEWLKNRDAPPPADITSKH